MPLASHSLGLLDVTRIIRFGALLGIIVLSAILYAFVMGTWTKDHLRPHGPMPASTVFMISTMWECEYLRVLNSNNHSRIRMLSRDSHSFLFHIRSTRRGFYSLAFLGPWLLQTDQKAFSPSTVIVWQYRLP